MSVSVDWDVGQALKVRIPLDKVFDVKAPSSDDIDDISFSMEKNLESLEGALEGHLSSEGIPYFEGPSNAEVSAEGNSKDEVLSNSVQEFLSGVPWSSSDAGADRSSTADDAMEEAAEEDEV